ncbi:hypothetical protein VTI28DRAFT_1478 [Corynascus sepedonium]
MLRPSLFKSSFCSPWPLSKAPILQQSRHHCWDFPVSRSPCPAQRRHRIVNCCIIISLPGVGSRERCSEQVDLEPASQQTKGTTSLIAANKSRLSSGRNGQAPHRKENRQEPANPRIKHCPSKRPGPPATPHKSPRTHPSSTSTSLSLLRCADACGSKLPRRCAQPGPFWVPLRLPTEPAYQRTSEPAKKKPANHCTPRPTDRSIDRPDRRTGSCAVCIV